jgi:hypothetical protein
MIWLLDIKKITKGQRYIILLETVASINKEEVDY